MICDHKAQIWYYYIDTSIIEKEPGAGIVEKLKLKQLFSNLF